MWVGDDGVLCFAVSLTSLAASALGVWHDILLPTQDFLEDVSDERIRKTANDGWSHQRGDDEVNVYSMR